MIWKDFISNWNDASYLFFDHFAAVVRELYIYVLSEVCQQK